MASVDAPGGDAAVEGESLAGSATDRGMVEPVAGSPLAPLMSDGDAGASVRREGERRRANREQETIARHPRVGKLILALSDEPRHVRSWSEGAVGEEALG